MLICDRIATVWKHNIPGLNCSAENLVIAIPIPSIIANKIPPRKEMVIKLVASLLAQLFTNKIVTNSIN